MLQDKRNREKLDQPVDILEKSLPLLIPAVPFPHAGLFVPVLWLANEAQTEVSCISEAVDKLMVI